MVVISRWICSACTYMRIIEKGWITAPHSTSTILNVCMATKRYVKRPFHVCLKASAQLGSVKITPSLLLSHQRRRQADLYRVEQAKRKGTWDPVHYRSRMRPEFLGTPYHHPPAEEE
uniref:Uncharacterized protein n=2 Tax=Rhodosorus marinus TaxID=101924 RepID=A0A7S3EJJ7_9RHOD